MTAIATDVPTREPAGASVRTRTAAIARRRVVRIPLPLALLLCVAAVHAGAWCFSTAPLNGPDEPSHASAVQYLAETGHFPARFSGDLSLSIRLNGLLAQALVGPITGHIDGRPDWRVAPAVNKSLRKYPPANGDGPNPAAANPPLYYAYAALAYRLSPDTSVLGRLTAIRLATVLLFVATVWLTWLVAAELFARGWLRVLATGLVALQPKLAFLGGVINPDVMLVALATGALLAALRLVRRGPTTGRFVALGLTTAGAALTQSRGLYLVGVAGLVAAFVAWRHAGPWRGRIRWAAIGFVPPALAALAAYLWVSAHNGGTGYGGQAPGAAGFNPREFLSYLWQFYLPRESFMTPRPGPDYGYRQVFIESFFGQFGALEVEYRPSVLDALQVGVAVGLLGLWTAVIARWRALRARWPEVAVLAVTFLSMMTLLHLVSYSSLRTGVDPIITGRYLLPGVAIYAAAIAFAVGSLPRRLGPPAAGFVLGLATLLALGGLGLNAARFYG